jgi:site-specific recombinase XerD
MPFDAELRESAETLPALFDMDQAIRRLLDNSKSPATRRSYQSDVHMFAEWCRTRGLCPLPAEPRAVLEHVTWAAEQRGLSAASISRRLAAIGYAHKLAGLPSPVRDAEILELLAGVRRTHGSAPKPKAALTADLIARLLAECPRDTLIGKRDRALISFGFAGAFRRSELVALQVENLTEVPEGYRVLIERSKTDQEGRGQTIAIPRGYKLKPVEAVQTWLTAAEISSGYLFRQVGKGGRLLGPLSAHAVAEIVKQRCRQAGLDPATYSGHSLRAGFLTSAAEAGCTPFAMQAVSRHKSLDVLSAYVRIANLFDNAAGASFL